MGTGAFGRSGFFVGTGIWRCAFLALGVSHRFVDGQRRAVGGGCTAGSVLLIISPSGGWEEMSTHRLRGGEPALALAGRLLDLGARPVLTRALSAVAGSAGWESFPFPLSWAFCFAALTRALERSALDWDDSGCWSCDGWAVDVLELLAAVSIGFSDNSI